MKFMPHYVYIYFLVNTNGTVKYIGQTSLPRDRWNDHRATPKFKNLKFKIYKKCSIEKANHLEEYMIKKFRKMEKPILNLKSGHKSVRKESKTWLIYYPDKRKYFYSLSHARQYFDCSPKYLHKIINGERPPKLIVKRS